MSDETPVGRVPGSRRLGKGSCATETYALSAIASDTIETPWKKLLDVKIGAPPSKSATLRDVAERAGVSVATASRVLSGSAAVRPATRDRVERAMRDLLYVPPGRAEPSGAIGCSCPSSATRCSRRSPRRWRRARPPPASRRSSATRPAPRCARSTTCTCSSSAGSRGWSSSARRSPTCAASTPLRAAPRAGRAARVRQRRRRVAAGHLGRRRRARRRAGSRPSTCSSSATGGSASSPATRSLSRRARRRAGREDALAAAGLDAPRDVAHERLHGRRRPPRAPRDRSTRRNGDRPTAVICSNDLMAIGAMQEAVARGLARPRRAVDRRIRRDRGGLVDAARADDGRAADRRDRRDGDRGAPGARRRPGADVARATSFGPQLRVGGTTSPPGQPPDLRPGAASTSYRSPNGS